MSFEEWYDQHFGSADPNVVKAGTIDLGDRPAVYNDDGTVSTERSFSIQDDQYGREVLLPQVVGGKMLSKKDAIKHYRNTGEHLGIYKDIPTANAYAKDIHERIPRLDTPDTFPVGNVMQSIRDLPGWAAYRMYRGATRKDLPGEGLSAREQEATLPPPPFPKDWSFSRAIQHFSDQIPDMLNPKNYSLQTGNERLKRWGKFAMQPGPYPEPPRDPYAPTWDVNGAWDRLKNQFYPPHLMRDIRQELLPDESVEAIKKNPLSLESMLAYGSLGISLSGGKGGREVPFGPRPVPRRVWDMWKPTDHPQIKVDELGNQYKATGTHYDKNTGESHIVVDPIVTNIPSPQDKMISDLAKQAGNNPTTWDQLSSWQKQWFEQQWKLGNTPSMKDVPAEGTGFGSGVVKAEDWQDNPYQKFLEGTFPAEELKPPEEPPSPQNPEPGSVLDNWQKKHGGLNPFTDYEAPPPMPPDKPEGYWGNLNDPKYWDRKDSGPLKGQQWADIYATPDTEFTVGPKTPEQIIKEQTEGIQSDLRKIAEWEKGLKDGDITQEQYDAAVDAITKGELPPLPPSKPNPVPDWWKPPDEGVVKDFQNIEDWNKKKDSLNNRFDWLPPEDNTP